MNQSYTLYPYYNPYATYYMSYPDMRQTEMMSLEAYTYPQNLPLALELIREALSGEQEDEKFYDYLISVAPSQEDKQIITGIRDDERKHYRLFRQVYYILTGQVPPTPPQEPFTKPESYCDGIQHALKGEIGAVVRYRRILFALQDRVLVNILTEIITDEIRHASLYNYLYSKNECRA